MILELPEIFIKKEGMKTKLVAERGIRSTFSKREIGEMGLIVTATEIDSRKPPQVAVFDIMESKDIQEKLPEEMFRSITIQKFKIVEKNETIGLPYLIPTRSDLGKPVDASPGKNIIPEEGLVSSNRLRNIQTDSPTKFEVERTLSLRDEELNKTLFEGEDEKFFEEIHEASKKAHIDKKREIENREQKQIEGDL